MKKLVALFLMLALMLGMSAMAEDDLGVQVIGGPDVAAVADNLDDMKLESTYTIDGFARVKPVSFEIIDEFKQYAKDKAGDNSEGGSWGTNAWARVSYGTNYYYKNILYKRAGANAEFAWLLMDVTNLAKGPVDLTQDVTVRVFFDEEYEFSGWVRMFNYDYDVYNGNKELIRTVLDPANSEETGMMYTCHMVFGCTLPNAVVEGKEPLRMEITMGDSVMTYHIRK